MVNIAHTPDDKRRTNFLFHFVEPLSDQLQFPAALCGHWLTSAMPGFMR